MSGSENLPIGPGILGFIALFVLALALWLLMRNMNARMRRMSYRDRGPDPRRDPADSAGPDSARPDSAGPDSAGRDSAGRGDSAGPGDSSGPDPAGPADDA